MYTAIRKDDSPSNATHCYPSAPPVLVCRHSLRQNVKNHVSKVTCPYGKNLCSSSIIRDDHPSSIIHPLAN